MPRDNRLAGFIDEELHPVEFEQQIVGELDIGLVNLVDQHDHLLICLERVPQFAADDVVADVMHPRIAQLPVAQTGNGVVFVEPLLRLGGRFDVPLDQRPAERAGDLMGEDGLAGPWLALHQQGPFQSDGGIDRHFQVASGDVFFGTLEPGHQLLPCCVAHSVGRTALRRNP